MLENLPVETIEYRLSPEEQVCSCCGGNLHEMSTQVRQELKYIPAELKVVKHVQSIYSCRHCEREEIETPVVTAPMPKPVHSGSLASPSLMAHIMNQKYVDGRHYTGKKSNFPDWGTVITPNPCQLDDSRGNRWLSPLYDRMHQLLLEKDILHADESTLQVLHEPGQYQPPQNHISGSTVLEKKDLQSSFTIIRKLGQAKMPRNSCQGLKDIYRLMDTPGTIRYLM
ncbi:IS66 family transposase zinc-finger binding domain-containing protein [Heyndrickxia sporothermodurans]|uniref:IS66 family transposase zinc-finger binding domain-containing protein n=2 Tax=Heyndrickxia sporothermodurans TaxID=46224 RepID=UPI0036D3AED6